MVTAVRASGSLVRLKGSFTDRTPPSLLRSNFSMDNMKTAHHRSKIVFPFLFIAFVFCLGACQPGSSPKSSVFDDVCEPPCWQGIDPGKTTKEEALQVLAMISAIEQGSIESASTVEPNDRIKWSWNANAVDFSGRIFLQENVATLIAIAPKDNRVQVKEVIDRLGEPEEILAFRTKGEQSIISVYFLYPSKGYGFLDYFVSSNSGAESTIAVKPEEEVNYIWFGEINSVTQNLTNGKIDRLPLSFVEDGIQKWIGYGQYDLLER